MSIVHVDLLQAVLWWAGQSAQQREHELGPAVERLE